MRIQKIAMCFLLIGCLAFMTSCASPEEDISGEKTGQVSEEEVTYFSGELTEEEREGDYLSLELMENLSVDADITSSLKYKDGLNSYYVKKRKDTKPIDNLKSYLKDPEIAGTSLSEILEQIEAESAGSFQTDKRKTEYYAGKKTGKRTGRLNVRIPYQDKKNGIKMELDFDQFFHNNMPADFDLYFTRDYELSEETENSMRTLSEIDIGRNMARSFPNYDMSDLSFGNSEEIAEELKQLLEGIAGYELADKYECMPLSRTNYQMVLSEKYGDEDTQIVPIEGEFYYYRFYQGIDSFPWIGAQLSRKEQVNAYSYHSIQASDEWVQLAAYGEDGIRELDIHDSLKTGAVYQKVIPCSMDTVLKKIKEYLGKNLMLARTVYGIEICYSGDFTENNDRIVRPFWNVSYWDGLNCRRLWLDAETGEYVQDLYY